MAIAHVTIAAADTKETVSKVTKRVRASDVEWLESLDPEILSDLQSVQKAADDAALEHRSERLERMAALLMERARDACRAEEAQLIKKAVSEKYPASELQVRTSHPKVGILRLDYAYPPAPGDIDFPGSFPCPVIYRVIPGFTFEMAQSGVMTDQVKLDFVEAVKWLTEEGVSCITGDCGFMFWFHELARQSTHIPVVLSSLSQIQQVEKALNEDAVIAIFTANGETLKPMLPLINQFCGVDVTKDRFLIVGCENVPGFEAVANGERVDVWKVGLPMCIKAMEVKRDNPKVAAFVLECTELPPYADLIKSCTMLPTYDSITAVMANINGCRNNPGAGLEGWQDEFLLRDAKPYEFASELTDEQLARVLKRDAIGTTVDPTMSGQRRMNYKADVLESVINKGLDKDTEDAGGWAAFESLWDLQQEMIDNSCAGHKQAFTRDQQQRRLNLNRALAAQARGRSGSVQ